MNELVEILAAPLLESVWCCASRDRCAPELPADMAPKAIEAAPRPAFEEPRSQSLWRHGPSQGASTPPPPALQLWVPDTGRRKARPAAAEEEPTEAPESRSPWNWDAAAQSAHWGGVPMSQLMSPCSVETEFEERDYLQMRMRELTESFREVPMSPCSIVTEVETPQEGGHFLLLNMNGTPWSVLKHEKPPLTQISEGSSAPDVEQVMCKMESLNGLNGPTRAGSRRPSSSSSSTTSSVPPLVFDD